MGPQAKGLLRNGIMKADKGKRLLWGGKELVPVGYNEHKTIKPYNAYSAEYNTILYHMLQ